DDPPLLRGRPPARGEPLVVRERGARLWIVPAAVLRALKAEAGAREVGVRIAEPRTVGRRVDANRPVLVLPDAAHVQLQRLPRPEPLAHLLGKDRRIAGDAIRVLRNQTRGLMVAVAVALVPLEPRDEHQRPLHADDADDVAEDVLASPFHERLLEALRESVIDRGGEVLLIDAVVLVRGEQFLGPD